MDSREVQSAAMMTISLLAFGRIRFLHPSSHSTHVRFRLPLASRLPVRSLRK